jgi:hypothetical protein
MTIFFIRAFREAKEPARRGAEQKARPVSTSQRRERVEYGPVMEWEGVIFRIFFFPCFQYILSIIPLTTLWNLASISSVPYTRACPMIVSL